MSYVLSLLLFLFVAVSAQNPRLCAFLTQLRDSTPAADGLQLPGFSWIPQSCTSDLVSVTSSSVGSITIFGQVVQGAQFTRFLQINSTQTLTFNLTLGFTFTYQGQSFSGFVSRSAKSVSWGSLEVSLWTGQLVSTSAGSSFYYDTDLFDGKELVKLRTGNAPGNMPDWAKVFAYVGYVNAQFDSKLATTGGFPGTVRGAFLNPKNVETVVSKSGFFDYLGDGPGLYKHLQQKCITEDQCEKSKIIGTVLRLASSALAETCASVTAIADSFYTQLDAEIFANRSDVTVLRVSALTQLSVNCDNKGVIGIRLSLTNPRPTSFPTEMFDDLKGLLGMLRTQSPIPNGIMAGLLDLGSGKIKTLHSGDIFSTDRGGFPIVDRYVTQNDVKIAFDKIIELLRTENDLVDALIVERYDSTDLAQKYAKSAPTPTWFGALRWFVARRKEFELFAQDTVMSLRFAFFKKVQTPNSRIPLYATSVRFGLKAYLDDDDIPQINFQNSAQVDLTSTDQVIVSGTITITNFDSIALNGDLKYTAITQFNAVPKTNNFEVAVVRGQFDHLTQTATFTANTDGELVHFSCLKMPNLKCYWKEDDKDDFSKRFRPHIRGLQKRLTTSPPFMQALSPLDVRPTQFGITTLVDILAEAASRQYYPTGVAGAFFLEDQIRGHLSEDDTAIVMSRVQNLDDDKIDIVINIRRLVYFSLEGTQNLDIPFAGERMKFPLVLSIDLHWNNIYNDDPDYEDGEEEFDSRKGLTFSIKGETPELIWAPVFVSGMLSGYTRSVVEVNLDIPNSGTLRVQTRVDSDQGPLMNYITANGIGSAEPIVDIINDGEASDKMMFPQQALGALTSIPSLAGKLFDGPFHFMFPMHNGKQVFSTHNTSLWLDRQNAWLNAPTVLRPTVGKTTIFCTRPDKGLTHQFDTYFSINQKPFAYVSLSFAAGDLFIATVANKWNAQLQDLATPSNGLHYIVAVATPVAVDNATCGSIAWTLKQPGSVWQFQWDVNSTKSKMLVDADSTRWQQVQQPVFGHWRDFGAFLSMYYPGTTPLPRFTSYSVSNLPNLLSPEIVPKYPTSVRTVAFDFKVETSDPVRISPSLSISDSQLTLVANLSKASQLEGTLIQNMDYKMIAVLTGIPFGGGNGICAITSLEENNPESVILNYGVHNRFRLTITAYLRRKDNFQNFRFDDWIDLGRMDILKGDPIRLFKPSLQEAFAKLPDWVRRIIALDIMTTKNILTDSSQISICLGKQPWLDGNMIPLGISISYSDFDFLKNTSFIPSRGALYVSNMKIQSKTLLKSSTSGSQGRLGIFPFVASVPIPIVNDLKVVIEPRLPTVALSVILTADEAYVHKNLKTTITINETVTISKLNFNAKFPVSGVSSENLEIFIDDSLVTSAGDNSRTIRNKFAQKTQWSFHFNDEKKMKMKRDGLDLEDPNALLTQFSNALPQVSQFLSNLGTDTIPGLIRPFNSIPLLQDDLENMFKEQIGNKLKEFDNLIRSTTDRTLTYFCTTLTTTLLPAKLGDLREVTLENNLEGVCKNLTLEGAKLKLEIVVDKVVTKNSAFTLDVAKLLGQKGAFPAGVGSNADFAVSLRGGLKLAIEVSFVNGQPKIRLLPASGVTFATEASYAGNMKATFGVFEVNFGNLLAQLGPVKFGALSKSDGGFDVTFDGAANMSASMAVNKRGTCGLTLEVTSMTGWAKGTPGAFKFDAKCVDGATFVDILLSAMNTSTLVDYFLDVTKFTTQLSKAVRAITNVIVPVVDELNKVPYVGPSIAPPIKNELQSFCSPEKIKKFVKDIVNYYENELMRKLTSKRMALEDQQSLDQGLLQEITKRLAELFNLDKLITPILGGNSTSFQWRVPLRKAFRQSLGQINFGLGDHGFAEFSMKGAPPIAEISFGTTVIVTFDKVKGVNVEFADNIYFDLTATFRIDELLLSGKLGFLGAELRPKVYAGISLVLPKTMNPNLVFNSSLTGDALLGLAGLAKELGIGDGSMQALPTFRARLSLKWNVGLTQRPFKIPPPKFEITDMGLCMGQLFGKSMLDVANYVQKNIMDPFDDVLGPDGFLVQPVEFAPVLFGRKMNFAEVFIFVAKTLCSPQDGCHYEGVIDAIQAFMTVARQVNDFLHILAVDKDGCSISSNVGNFIVDFSKNFQRKRYTHEDMFDINKLPRRPIWDNGRKRGISMPGLNQSEAAKVQGIFTQFDKDEFGIAFHLDFDSLPSALISLILGDPIPIIGVKIPKLTVGIEFSWTIPVYPSPPISIVIGFGVGLTVDIGEIVYTSQGITDTIRTKNPAKLINGLAISTVLPNGAPRYILTIWVKLIAGVEVSIFFIKAELTVYIVIEAKARIVGIHNEPYVPFTEIGWMIAQNKGNILAIFEKRIIVTLGIQFKIKLCLIFTCVDVISLGFEVVLLDKTIPPGHIPPPAALANGAINPDVIGTGGSPGKRVKGLPLIRIYDALDGLTRNYDYMAGEGEQVLTKLTDTINPVTFNGNPKIPYQLQIQSVKNSVYLGNLNSNANLIFTFPDAESFSVTSQGLFPLGSGGSFFAGCGSTLLDQSYGNGPITVQGAPCPLSILGNEASNILIKGTSNDYKGKPVTIKNTAESVTSSITTPTTYTLNNVKMTAGPDVTVNLPMNLQTIIVNGHPSKSTSFTINEVPGPRSVQVLGSPSDDSFTIPGLQEIDGALHLQGGQGVNSVKLQLDAKFGNSISITPSSMLMKGGSTEHLVTWQSIQKRTIDLYGDSKTIFNIIAPEDGSLLQVFSHGQLNTNIEQRVQGCNQNADVRIKLQGGGTQIVVIGNNEAVIGFGCTVRITGSAASNQTDIIRIQARLEKRPLTWTLDEGSLQVHDVANTENWFRLLYSDIDQLEITFGDAGTTLDFAHGAESTEYVFDFVEKNPKTPNSVRVAQTVRTVLLKGDIAEVSVGPEALPKVRAPNPFQQYAGLLAIAGTGTGTRRTKIIGDCGVGPLAPAQHYKIAGDCLTNVLSDGSARGTPAPSTWMCNKLKEVRFTQTACSSGTCSVRFLNNPHIMMTTGEKDDIFTAERTVATFEVSLGKGKDFIAYGNSYPNTAGSSFDLGIGEDKMHVTAPIAAATAYLGDDNEVDLLTIFPGQYRAQVQKRGVLELLEMSDIEGTQRVGPLGPNSGDILTIGDYTLGDIIDIRGSSETAPQGTLVGPIIVSAPTAGQVVLYNLQSNTAYQVTTCVDGAVIVFDGRKKPGEVTAVNWLINVTLPDWRTNCFIRVHSEPNSKGTLNFIVRNVDQTYTAEVGRRDISTTSIGDVLAQIEYIEFLGIYSPRSVLEMRVDGTPANAELVVETAPKDGSYVELRRITNDVLIINADVKFLSPETLSLGTYGIISSGGSAVSNTFSAGNTPRLQFIDGCARFAPQPNIPSASAAFLTQKRLYKIPTISNCLFQTVGTLGLNIIGGASSNVLIAGIDKTTTPSIFSVEATNVTVTDSNVWSKVEFTGPTPTMVVANRFQVTAIGTRLTVNSDVISNTTNIVLDYNQIVTPFDFILGQSAVKILSYRDFAGNQKGQINVKNNVIPIVKLTGALSFNATFPRSATLNFRALSGTNLLFNNDSITLTGTGRLTGANLGLWENGLLHLTDPVADLDVSMSLLRKTSVLDLTVGSSIQITNFGIYTNFVANTFVGGFGLPVQFTVKNSVLSTSSISSFIGNFTVGRARSFVGWTATSLFLAKQTITSKMDFVKQGFDMNNLDSLNLIGQFGGLTTIDSAATGTAMNSRLALLNEMLSLTSVMKMQSQTVLSGNRTVTISSEGISSSGENFNFNIRTGQVTLSQSKAISFRSVFPEGSTNFSSTSLSSTDLSKALEVFPATATTRLNNAKVIELTSWFPTEVILEVNTSTKDKDPLSLEIVGGSGIHTFKLGDVFSARGTVNGEGDFNLTSLSYETITIDTKDNCDFHFDSGSEMTLEMNALDEDLICNLGTERFENVNLDLKTNRVNSIETVVHFAQLINVLYQLDEFPVFETQVTSPTSNATMNLYHSVFRLQKVTSAYLATNTSKKSSSSISLLPLECVGEECETFVESSEFRVDLMNKTIETSLFNKNLNVKLVTEFGLLFLNESGTLNSFIDLEGNTQSSGTGVTHRAKVRNDKGKIIVDSTKYQIAETVIESKLALVGGQITMIGDNLVVHIVEVHQGRFDFRTRGMVIFTELSLDGVITFDGRKGVVDSDLVFDFPEVLDPNTPRRFLLQAPEGSQVRKMWINNHSDISVDLPSMELDILVKDGLVFNSLNIDFEDGENTLHFTGPLIPKLKFGSNATGALTSVMPLNIRIPSGVTYEWETTRIMSSQSNHETCFHPRVVCTPIIWNEMALHAYDKLPCNSKYAQKNQTCIPSDQSIYMSTSNQPIACFLSDLKNESGWTVYVNQLLPDESIVASFPVRATVAAMYGLHLFLLVIGYCLFGLVMTEGWMVLLITSFLPRTVPEIGWSRVALSIVSSAEYMVDDWWITVTDDGAGVCNSDLSKMVNGWALIGTAGLVALLLTIRHLTRDYQQKHRRLNIAYNFVLRFLCPVGLFWIAPAALAHIPVPEGSLTFVAFILLSIVISTIILTTAFIAEATEKPTWMQDPPGWIGAGIWSKNVANYIFLFVLMLLALLCGVINHINIPTDGLPNLILGVLFTVAVAIMVLIKFHLQTKSSMAVNAYVNVNDDEDVVDVKEYKKPNQIDWQLVALWTPLSIISFIYLSSGIAFIVLFRYNPYLSDTVFLALWLVWATMPIFYVFVEMYRFYQAKEKLATAGVPEYELANTKYQQF